MIQEGKRETLAERLKDLDDAMGAWIRGGDGKRGCRIIVSARIKDDHIIAGQAIIQEAVAALDPLHRAGRERVLTEQGKAAGGKQKLRFDDGCECEHGEFVSVPLSRYAIRKMKQGGGLEPWTNENIICTMLQCGCRNDITDELEDQEAELDAESQPHE